MSFNYFEAAAHVAKYSKYRPYPPRQVIETVVKFLQEKVRNVATSYAADVGCGSGQSTQMLSPFFDSVVGLDPSENVVAEANAKNVSNNVNFRVSQAEKIDLRDESVDVVTVAQAVHWFDKPKFYSEVQRILKPHGVLAMYGYTLPRISTPSNPEYVSDIVKKFYNEVLGEYVYPESRQVYIENYRDPIFNDVSFVEDGKMKRMDPFSSEIVTRVDDVKGFIYSWSGFQRYVREQGTAAANKLLEEFQNELEKEFPPQESSIITAHYEYFLLMGRKA